LITVSSAGSAGSAFPDARNLLIQSIVVSSTTPDHWWSADDAVISSASRRSASFPVCLIDCLLDIARAPLRLACNLLRDAFRLLRFVTSQFSNLLLDLACNVLGSAFHLIAVHGVSLKCGSSA